MSADYNLRAEFVSALRGANAAAEGPSNDDEIAALWRVAEIACVLLDITVDDPEEDL